MTQHPEEGTLHAYIDGQLSPAEATALELHVGECARCAAALAEARGYVAAASRVITALDAAPSSAAKAATAVAAAAAAPLKRVVRPPVFRVPYARAAALLVLVGGTALVVDRTGTFARGKSTQAESPMLDATTGSRIAPLAAAGAGTAAGPVVAAESAAATDLSTGASGGTTGSAKRDAAAPQRFSGGTETDGPSRARPAERSAPAPTSEPAGFDQRGVAGGTAMRDTARAATQPAVFAGKDSAAAVPEARALAAAPPPPPARATIRLEEVVVTSAPTSSPTVSRFRTRGGAIITLTEEPLRTSFAEESVAARQRAPSSPSQRRVAAPMAATPINSYRWSSVEQGKTYTLSGPLSVAELEALSQRLSELERLPRSIK